jgi:MFS family permease
MKGLVNLSHKLGIKKVVRMLKKMNQSNVMPWIIWGISAAFVLYQFLLQSSVSVMIPGLMRDLNINIVAISVLSSSFFYPYVILQIPAGILADRFGARVLLLCSIFMCGLAAALFSVAHSMSLSEFSRILMGIASAPSVVCGMYLACRWFDKSKFALVAGMLEMIGLLGGAVGQFFLVHLVTAWGWRAAMLVCAMAGLLLLILSIIFIKNEPQAKSVASCPKLQFSVLCGKFLDVMLVPQVWIACIYSGLMFSIVTGFAGLWSIPFLQARYGISANMAAGESALVFVGTAIGTTLVGWLACRLGKLKMIMIVAAILCSALMFSVLYVSVHLVVMAILLTLLGISSGAYVLAFAVVKQNTCPQISATAMGFTNMVCIILGAPLLQPLIAWLLHRYSNSMSALSIKDYQHALLPLCVFVVLAFFVSLLVKDKPCCEE